MDVKQQYAEFISHARRHRRRRFIRHKEEMRKTFSKRKSTQERTNDFLALSQQAVHIGSKGIYNTSIRKRIRLSTQSCSLQKELTSLTVKVSSIDPVVIEVAENDEGCSRFGSKCDSDCWLKE